MSEAKPQDGSTVQGYRELSYGEIGKMNHFKELSRHFIKLLREEMGDTLGGNPEGWEAHEWIREAEFDLKRACISICRAVDRPDFDS